MADSRNKRARDERERLARLTDKQRECLRLVYAHMSSKEIAPLLGVEPGTVDQYIKAAMRILGVSDRRAAAKMLAEQEDRICPAVGIPAAGYCGCRRTGDVRRID